MAVACMEKFGVTVGGAWPPLHETDMNLLYDLTSITIGDGDTTSFWHSPWLQGCKPKDIVPSIFVISKQKRNSMAKALDHGIWIDHINISSGITVQHIIEFADLWSELQDVILNENIVDTIAWKNTANASVTLMKPTVWKIWAPPKHKFFTWLVIQD